MNDLKLDVNESLHHHDSCPGVGVLKILVSPNIPDIIALDSAVELRP